MAPSVWKNGAVARAVQRGRAKGTRSWGGRLLTALAVLVVVLALTVPDRLEDVRPGAFLRIPLELIVFVAVVLLLPRGRTRTILAVAAGLVLAVTVILRLLDMGFLEVLDRPFEALADWRYAGTLLETLRQSFGDGLGTALVVGGALVGLGLLVLVPLAVLRLTRAVADHRRRAAGLVTVCMVSWLLLALLDVEGDAGSVAARETAGYVYDQVSRVPVELRAQREFTVAVRGDPVRGVPPAELLTALRGKDVLLVFVESFGRVAIEDPPIATGVSRVLDTGRRELEAAGFHGRSAFLTSPTFGGVSWLAHSTLQSGVWVDSEARYDALVSSSRMTLSRLFGQAGWRTVGVVPANTREWPQARFYDFDKLYDSRNLGYRGPRFGYANMPDQYTLEALHRLELAQQPRLPVMAEIDLISSHVPWAPTPPLVGQSDVGDGSVYRGMRAELPSEREVWSSPTRVRAAYGQSIEYSLGAVLRFLTSHGHEDMVVVMVGDHQPAAIVSGNNASRDVPITIISGDRGLLDRLAPWGWHEGLRPRPDAPVWSMADFRDRFVAAFSPEGQTGTEPAKTP